MSSEQTEKYPPHIGPITVANGGATIDIFPHKASSTTTTVLQWPCPSGSGAASGLCVIIDPCADYNPTSGAVTFDSADSIFSWVTSKSLSIVAVLDTHVHADHLTAAPYLRARSAEAAAVSKGAAHATDFLDLMHRFGASAASPAVISAAPRAAGTRCGIGAHFPGVQQTMAGVLATAAGKAQSGTEPASDAIAYDVLLSDNDVIAITPTPAAGCGPATVMAVTSYPSDAAAAAAAAALAERGVGSLRVMHTPGHTPACVSFVVYSPPATTSVSVSAPAAPADGAAACASPVDSSCLIGAVVAGDTIFAPDMGSARCDFPGGSVTDLWRSAQRILSLPEHTLVVSGHDYPEGKARVFAPVTTVGAHKKDNIHLHAEVDADTFAETRAKRDAQLAPPKLLAQSITWNIGTWRNKSDADGDWPGYQVSIQQYKEALADKTS